MFTDARDRPAVGDAEESELVHEAPGESRESDGWPTGRGRSRRIRHGSVTATLLPTVK